MRGDRRDEKGADGRDDRLNIQDGVDYGRLAVFERAREKDRADGRVGEARKKQKTPRANAACQAAAEGSAET